MSVESSLCYGLSSEDYSVGFHVGAIFVVLFSSIFGCALPMITKFIPFLRRNPFIFVAGKTAATGVLLSVSMIHLLDDAIENFEEPCIPESFSEFYPAYPFLFALSAALVMHMIDFELAEIAERWMKRKEALTALESPLKVIDDGSASVTVPPPVSGEMQRGGPHADDECVVVAPSSKGDRSGEQSGESESNEPTDGNHIRQPQTSEHLVTGCGHVHSAALPDDMPRVRRIISAVCMEFGVTLHSVFVGMDVGLTTDSALKPLLIALVFHQLFEGMSLGSRLVDAKFKFSLEVALAVIFSFSAPVGMTASTIAVAVRKDAMKGGGFVMLMGTLSSFCGGILLYLAFNLLFVDFGTEMKMHCGEGKKHRRVKKIVMFSALWFGMLIMALIGKWA